MTKPMDRPTRVAVDLLESAAVAGARESRSAKQQLDHWARIGRAVSMHESGARRRIESVLTGDLELRDLSVEEHVVFNAELDVAIQEAARAASFAEELANEGVTTVALDSEGRLVRYHPDGSTTVLD